MKKLYLDGERISDRKALHTTLSRVLNFPDWYGGNLDALHDCLTDVSEEVTIYVLNYNALKAALGDYADTFIKVMEDSSAENHRIHFTVL